MRRWAIYNAFADRVPVYLVVGNHADSAVRNGIEAYHSAQISPGWCA